MNQSLWLLVGFAVGAVTAGADPVKIISPDKAQTGALWTMTDHRFFWNPKSQTFYAQITFDNHFYVSQSDPAARDTYLFSLPGITFDPTNKTFYAAAAGKEKVGVAVLRKTFLGPVVTPLPGTVTFIIKRSGSVNVVLTFDPTGPRRTGAGQWLERSDDWSLQNLLRDQIGGQPPHSPPAAPATNRVPSQVTGEQR